MSYQVMATERILEVLKSALRGTSHVFSFPDVLLFEVQILDKGHAQRFGVEWQRDFRVLHANHGLVE